MAKKKLYALSPDTYNQKTAVGLAAAQKAEPNQSTTASRKFIQVKGGWACQQAVVVLNEWDQAVEAGWFPPPKV